MSKREISPGPVFAPSSKIPLPLMYVLVEPSMLKRASPPGPVKSILESPFSIAIGVPPPAAANTPLP